VGGGTVNLSSDTVNSNVAGQSGGGLYIAGGSMVTFCNDTVAFNSDFTGGGMYIEFGTTVYIDSFTVANTINNTDSFGLNGSFANIVGPYTLSNC